MTLRILRILLGFLSAVALIGNFSDGERVDEPFAWVAFFRALNLFIVIDSVIDYVWLTRSVYFIAVLSLTFGVLWHLFVVNGVHPATFGMAVLMISPYLILAIASWTCTSPKIRTNSN
jgi:hypothetical protein